MIQVTCTHCGLRVLVPSTVQGRSGVCFGCGAPMQVPIMSGNDPLAELRFKTGDRVADRYVIDLEIGRGGMGVVYKAHDDLIDEAVALKFMNPRTLSTQRGQQLFIREAQIARRLRHENIVSVHDVSSTAEGVLYLSMEFLQGAPLRAYLRRNRNARKLVEVRLAIDLTLKILLALEYAHRYVVHRDLKPENVMLLSGERVKVLDFGLAVAEEDNAAEAVVSPDKPKKLVGTVAYAAPEQHRHQAVDFRADLYSVGLILRELLTLRTPIDEQISLMDARTDIAPSVVAVVDKSLNMEKERRWQSAREFHDALKTAYDESYRRRTFVESAAEGAEAVSTEDMVYLEGGNFLMGFSDVREEAPQFETQVGPFYLDRYPVTVGDYAKFIEQTNHPEPKFWRDPELNGLRQPVTGVTWDDARAYARWTGKDLPSEKQWEFAARGRENRLYPWGNLEPDTTRCNFGDYLGMPSMVTMHDSGRSPDGVNDLAGNVFEWVLDGFAPYRPEITDGDNTKSSAVRRVVRGGSWHSKAPELRTMARKGLFPETQLTTVGFRCALAADRLTPGD